MHGLYGKLGIMRIEDYHIPNPPPRGDELPCSDGEPLETERHFRQMTLLIESLSDAWRDRYDYFVHGDMFVYYSEPQAREAQIKGTTRYRGPDLFVVLGTERRERKSWVAWEEGGKLPDIIIEIISPTTEHIDRGVKMDLYARIWRTPEYYLYDPAKQQIEGYALNHLAHAYEPMMPLENGDLPVRQLGLRLGLRDLSQDHLPGPFLRWIHQDGTVLPTGRERADQERLRAEQERQRAEQERQRAERAEQRLRELEAELKKRTRD